MQTWHFYSAILRFGTRAAFTLLAIAMFSSCNIKVQIEIEYALVAMLNLTGTLHEV